MRDYQRLSGKHAGQHGARLRKSNASLEPATGPIGANRPIEPRAEPAALADERLREARVVLFGKQWAHSPKQIVQLVGVPRRAQERLLDLLDRIGVQQLAQLLAAHELAQQVAVEGERLGAALRRRRVVLVHVRRHVLEQERRRDGRRRRRLHLHEVELARLDPAQEALERGQVEDVLQDLAVGLEDDRELGVAARDLQQALRLQPLLPERRPLPGPAAGDEQRA